MVLTVIEIPGYAEPGPIRRGTSNQTPQRRTVFSRFPTDVSPHQA